MSTQVRSIRRQYQATEANGNTLRYLLAGTMSVSDMQAMNALLEGVDCAQATSSVVELFAAALQSGGKLSIASAPGRPVSITECIAVDLSHSKPVKFNQSTVGVLLFYRRPQVVVAEALDAGTDARAALDEWCRTARNVFDLLKRNRRRGLLVDIDSALANQEVFLGAVTQEFGLSSSKPRRSLVFRPRPRSYAEVFARQVIAESDEATSLASKLAASETRLPGSETVLDPESIYAELRAGMAEAELRLETLIDENELLHAQLESVQEELQEKYFEILEQREKYARMKGFHKGKKQELLERQKQLKVVRKERDELKNRLERVHRSIYWRVAFPIRWLVRILRGKNR